MCDELYGDGQLGLFGARPSVPPLERWARLAAALPAHVRFGTSSWTFPGWAGVVYHRAYRNQQAFVRESLEEYARFPLFRTVGIDRSYYGPIPEKDLRRYAEQLPPGFRCVAKVWKEITTRVFPKQDRERAGTFNRRFLDVALFEDAVLGPIDAAFAEHQGPFVLEIPPAPGPVNPKGFADAVARFLANAPRHHTYAFELRDRRLMTPRYFDVLRDLGGAHVFNYWERMPGLAAQLEAAGGSVPGVALVARLMIPPGKRYADLKKAFDPFDRLVAPQPAMRDEVVELIDAAGEADVDAWIIANNKAEGSSPLTVIALADRLATR